MGGFYVCGAIPTMDLQFKTFPFELKASSGDGSEFSGLVSVFHNIDSYGEIVDDGAFDADLPDFMAEGFIGGLNHNWDSPIGTPQKGTKVVSNGLHLVGSVIDTTHGLDVRKMLKAGVVKKLSIGYKTMGLTELEDEDAVKAYWEQKGYTPNAQDIARSARGAVVLTRLKLYEGSPVTVPANDLAMITAVKAARDAAAKVLAADDEDEPIKAKRLEKIRAIAALSDGEDVLRDVGLSRTERGAFISRMKTLLRDAGSDDIGTLETGPTPEDIPEPSEPEASETPAPEVKDAEEVTAPTVTMPLYVPPDFTSDLSAIDEPLKAEKEAAKLLASQRLYQRNCELEARMSRNVPLSAGKE